MLNAQRAFLNATGPLYGLHYCIENDSAPTCEEIKAALEQALCLLGSANTQLSILRRQRVLAAINRSKTNPGGTTSAYCKIMALWRCFPLFSLQNRPSCQGASQKIWRKLQGNPSLDVVPSLKANIETRLTSTNTWVIQTPLHLSQMTKGHVQKMGFFVPLPRRDASQTLRQIGRAHVWTPVTL